VSTNEITTNHLHFASGPKPNYKPTEKKQIINFLEGINSIALRQLLDIPIEIELSEILIITGESSTNYHTHTPVIIGSNI